MRIRNSLKIDFPLDVSSTPSKIIIDTHGGLQDIIAIIFAYLYIHKTGIKKQIIGITCVSGKNTLQNAVKSALLVNKLVGAKIPVFKGQRQGLMLEKEFPKTFMTQNFTHIQQKLYQQLDQDIKNWQPLIQHQKAVDFINRSAKHYKDDLAIVSFGPTTNISLAHRLEESLDLVKMVSLTGGQYMGMGNTSKGGVEANFAFDSLASFIIFDHGKTSKAFKDKIFVNVIEKSLSFCFKLAINSCIDTGKLDPIYDDIFVNMMGINSIVLNCAPLLTILPVLEPKSVKKCYHRYGQIVRDGDHIDGLLAIGWLGVGIQQGYGPFFYIYEDYDKQLITELFVTAFVNK